LDRKKHLIAGVDPGTTTGLAAVDFMGRVVDLHSSKDMGMDRAIERLVSLGSVSVIATDVSPVPGFVSRMAGNLVQSSMSRRNPLLCLTR